MRILSALTCLALTAACAIEDTSVTLTVGASGGTLLVAGATVRIPPNALTADTDITVSVTDETAPAGHLALSQIFSCAPSGLDFPVPVVMEMPFASDGGAATMLWSSGDDPTFKDVGGTIDGEILRAEVRHFSRGFVGRKL